jgi:hypothetical protein
MCARTQTTSFEKLCKLCSVDILGLLLQTLAVLFVIIIPIILFNLVIAVISSSYEEIIKHAPAELLRNKVMHSLIKAH